MKRRVTQLCLILLALVLCLTAFASCKKDIDPSEEVTTAEKTKTTEAGTDDDGDDYPHDNLPPDVTDYSGKTFRFFGTQLDINEYFVPDDFTSDIISDAVYERNLYIEDLYKIEITEDMTNHYSTGVTKQTLATSINGGIDFADAYVYFTNENIGSATNGYLLNIYDMPVLQLDAEYWDSEFTDLLTFSDTAYMLTGDIETCDEMHQYLITANNKAYTDLGEEKSLYELVKNYEWTYENMQIIYKKYSEDADQDGSLTVASNDKIGFMYDSGFACYTFMAAGFQIFTLSGEGENLRVTMNVGTQRALDIVKVISDIVTDKQNTTPFTTNYANDYGTFAEDKILFINMPMWEVFQRFSDVTFDCMYMPFPMVDASEEEYHSPVHMCFEPIAFPATLPADRREFAATIIEALAYYSSDVNDAMNETTLLYRMPKTPESKEVVKALFASKTYDLEYIGNVSGFKTEVIKLINARNFETYSSSIVSQKTTMAEKLKKLLSNYVKGTTTK